jgi:hypothetical protein
MPSPGIAVPRAAATIRIFSQFIAISASSATDAWAVGLTHTTSDGVEHPLAEHWDGNSWTVIPSPNPGQSTQLNGVTALSATNAWAVGTYFNGTTFVPLTEHWDGTSWTVIPSPAPGAYGELFSVTATSATDLWAVGQTGATTSTNATLILHGNGASWTQYTDNSPFDSALGSVTATSATDAWAVGYTLITTDGLGVALIEHWDGTSWTTRDSNTPGLTGQLNSVTATSPTDAWAVGTINAEVILPGNPPIHQLTLSGIVEHWDGTSWSQVPHPGTATVANGAAGFELFGVTATSATNAWAVGDMLTNNGASSFIEHLDGTTWREQALDSTQVNSQLLAVTATSAADAWAVGQGFTSAGVNPTLSGHFDGISWSQVPSPNPGTANVLTAIAVQGNLEAWAVGSTVSADGSLTNGLIEHWDGGDWRVTPSPTGGSFATFHGVAARSATDAWAVGQGSVSASGTPITLVEHWNGSNWSPVAAESPGCASTCLQANLMSVTAVSASNAWAVGAFAQPRSHVLTALIEHWDGAAWTQVTVSPPGTFSELSSVYATSANDVWAVGEATPAGGPPGPLVEHWNGSAWVQESTPGTGSSSGQLNSVFATSPADAWAVGYTTTASGAHASLAEHWNGASWSIVTVPGSGAASELESVTATSPGDAWAVGDTQTAAGVPQVLTEHWDGSTWAQVSSPGPVMAAELHGVAATPPQGFPFAVGITNLGLGGSGPIAQRWTGSSWKPVPVATP